MIPGNPQASLPPISLDQRPWSVRMADTILTRNPLLSKRWHYEPGVAGVGISKVWQKTGEVKYYEYIRHNIDTFIDQDGKIRTYRLEEYNLDQINEGRLLFLLYETTGDMRYRNAAYLLREQIRTQPRTPEGGFWHKLIYPQQMWLDGIYMAAPFYTQFAATFDEPEIFDDVAKQITLIDKHTRDTHTGLLYHAWDSSRSQLWANGQTGCSPNFWARAIGWFMMALADVLDHFPRDHPQRAEIVNIFRRTARAIVEVQDETSGVWFQVIDQGMRAGNYMEASASCMFVYALAKGVRLGYLEQGFMQAAQHGYRGIFEYFVTVDENGCLNLNQICSVGGLGGTPYRDGSFEYYVSEKVIANDYKGTGPFILASVEMEI